MRNEDRELKAAGRAWRLACAVVREPSRALESVRTSPEALWDAIRLYLLFLACTVAFYAYKPAGFPPAGPQTPFMPAQGGVVFWAKVEAWGPVLTAVSVVLSLFFVRVLTGGRLALRLLGACACAATPLLLVLAYRASLLSRGGLALGLLLLAAGLAAALRRQGRELWRPWTAWVLAVNSVNLALMPLFAAAVALRAASLYNALEIVLLFAVLGWGTYGLARLARIPNARAFCALFLATLCQLFLVFAFHFLGLIPRETLKALMTV